MFTKMTKSKHTFKIITFSLTLLILLGLITSIIASESSVPDDNTNNEEDDVKDFEELLALDEEEEAAEDSQVKSAEAEVLTKAQRIVPELNMENYKRVVFEGNEFVLVLGYAPWCFRSAELMPRFAEAANILNKMGNPIVLAKIDAERHPKAASVLGISGFPTLLLFVNGSSQVYTGGFSTEEIVIWARKKTGMPTIRLNSVPESEDFLSKNPMFIIGLFEKFEGKDYEEFAKAAVADNEIQFAEASSSQVAEALFPGVKTKGHFLGLVKNEPETHVAFEDTLTMGNILQFLEYNKFPLVTTLTEQNSIRVYASPVKLQVFVFGNADDFKNLLAPLQDVARKFKSKILFVYVDITDDNLAKPFLTLFGYEDSKKAVVTAFDNKVNAKYLLESDPTAHSLEEFCSGLLHGTLSTYFKSQPIPNNENATVLTVVGRTFENLVLTSPQNVLLEVYAPWCVDCEDMSKKIVKLAKHFKGFENLIIARIDASTNEHPELQITEYPMLLFYPSADKSNPTKVSSKSSLKDLAIFINKNAKVVKHNQEAPAKDEL
ncbi:protein disulfide isomerase-like 1-6 isoform X1 [Papaver somniferum]|uniref:protein disulfide isomerase-like 1-6 isoform X1 n=1 Tax=Papaver somniferum TaxID=3469 RepID=UPI000E6F81B4|nr:protein disulfide isomerase-like 1-6 isoform X1 [Papaver somniferum]